MKPSVSVCIANHNYAHYVTQAIESCLAQTHPDVEIIVVDDGSTDDSLAVLEQYRGRVTLLSQENSGQFVSVRRAFDASTGDLVIFLDADDLLDPTTAARAAEEFRREPDAGRIQWRLRVIGPHGEPTDDMFPPATWKLSEGDLRDHVLSRRTYVWPPTSGNAYPRSVLDVVFSVIRDERPLIDLLLAETTPLLGPVVNLQGACGSYRWHTQNFSGSSEMRKDATTFLHDRIEETMAGHHIVRRLCQAQGIVGCPVEPTSALDWAFAGYRLGSLRIDPSTHPLAGDRRLPLAMRGIRAVLTQPDYSYRARGRRAAWLAATALAPASAARRLVDRVYLAPPTSPKFSEIPVRPA